VTITRPHHPFEGQCLEVLRHARMRGSLLFVLILPDGSKSLIPAAWTDFKTVAYPDYHFAPSPCQIRAGNPFEEQLDK
jgi:hypothetical protein